MINVEETLESDVVSLPKGTSMVVNGLPLVVMDAKTISCGKQVVRIGTISSTGTIQ